MASYIVTGCLGFIGSHLTEELIERGHTVYGIDNLSHQAVSSRVFKNSGRFVFVPDDINKLTLKHLFNKSIDRGDEITGVFHQAALGSVPRSIENPIKTFEANVLSTLALFEFCAENKINKIVFASSSSVYGNNGGPYYERNQLLPKHPYGHSKKITEEIAESYAGKVNSIGLRYFNVYGPNQLGDCYSGVIGQWISNALASCSLELNGSTEISRHFTYVDDVVKANILAMCRLNNVQEIKYHTVLNIGREELISLGTILMEIKKHIKTENVKIILKDYRNFDVVKHEGNFLLARELIKFKAVTTIEEGISRIFSHRMSKNSKEN